MKNQKGLFAVIATFVALFGFLVIVSQASADDGKPSALRVANPGVGIGGRPVVAYSAWSLLHIKGQLEEEFKPDNIPVTWTFARGAGPAVNELFANGIADITLLGDLPSVIGRSGGLKTRVLAGAGFNNLYIAVPADSPVQSIKDLVGKKLAVFKGTCIHLAANRILASQGHTEKDVRTINMDQPSTLAALTTKDVDAAIATSDLLALADRGTARIIYSSQGDPRFACNQTIVVQEDFLHRYPSIVKRVLRDYVRVAKWVTDNEADPAPIYQLFSKSGIPFSSFKRDWSKDSFKVKVSPLVDPYLRARYTTVIADAQKFGLIRKTFDFDSWADTTLLDEVIKEEHLENFWPQRPAL